MENSAAAPPAAVIGTTSEVEVVSTPAWRAPRNPRRILPVTYMPLKNESEDNGKRVATTADRDVAALNDAVMQQRYPAWSLVSDDERENNFVDFTIPNLLDDTDDYPHPGEGDGNFTTSEMMHLAKWLGGERPRWKSKAQYLLSCVGYAVGLGTLWRFPYLCYANGGAAFLLAYAVCMMLLGLPMFLIELGLGQKLLWRDIHPKLTGIGFTALSLAFLCAVYCNIITTWALSYLLHSFRFPLPWSVNGLDAGDSATKFWVENTLQKAPELSLSYVRGTNWQLIVSLTAAWTLVFLATVTQKAWRRSMIYAVALIPPIGLLVLLVRGISLPGAWDGIWYLLRPQWGRLLDVHVWATAGSQVFYGLGIGWGCLVNYASFNPRRNNFFYDAYIVVAANALISFIAGLAVFSVVGHISFVTGRPLEAVAKAGSGLIFIVYPAGLARFPVPWLFSIVFFGVLIMLAVASELAMVEVILTSLIEASFFRTLRRGTLVGAVCAVLWVLGLPFVTPIGIYLVELMDAFVGSLALYSLALLEVFAVLVLYGIDRFADDCYEMTGRRLNTCFRTLIRCALPSFLVSIIVCSVISFTFFGAQSSTSATPWIPATGDGCVNNCTAPSQGKCNVTLQYCDCFPGWGGRACHTPLTSQQGLWCPEDCNGQGLCETTTGTCRCYAAFIGPSCHGTRFRSDWPNWGHALGWTIAAGTLVPIPLVFLDRSLRHRLKQRLDRVPPELPTLSCRTFDVRGASPPHIVVPNDEADDPHDPWMPATPEPPKFHAANV